MEVASSLSSSSIRRERSGRSDGSQMTIVSRVFHSLLLNLLNDCSDDLSDEHDQPESITTKTISHPITIETTNGEEFDARIRVESSRREHRDPQTRAALIKVLTPILQQGTDVRLIRTADDDRRQRRIPHRHGLVRCRLSGSPYLSDPSCVEEHELLKENRKNLRLLTEDVFQASR